jgi:hypothetical protein
MVCITTDRYFFCRRGLCLHRPLFNHRFTQINTDFRICVYPKYITCFGQLGHRPRK